MCHEWQLFSRVTQISNKNLKRIEDWFDPEPDSKIQPKARGLLHMESE